jgi:multiple sugar transport system permease protein/putative aldouronate transport system permease protein
MEERKGFLSKRVTLKKWQKLLIILGCVALAAAAAYIYCEHIASPVYSSAVRTRLKIEDTDTLMASGDEGLTVVKLDILGGLRDELTNVGSKNKGLLYRNVSDEINAATGELIKPKDLKNMIGVSLDAADETSQTLLITVKNSDAALTRQITDAAVNQLSALIFGAAAAENQVSLTETDVNGDGAQLQVAYRISDEAAGGLPDKFRGKTLDLVNPLNGYLADDAFLNRVAAEAGVSAKPADLRKRITLTTTADPSALTLTVSWTDTDGAVKIAKAAGEEMARSVFGSSAEAWQATVDEPTVISENVKVWPVTALIVILAALIVLVISYGLFSQQPLFDTLIVIFFVLFTFICVFPFYYLFINTISDNNLVAGGQINFFPRGIHFTNYDRILGISGRNGGNSDVLIALGVTLARTVLGTALMVITSAWAGYLVTKQKMWHRSFWYRALVITMYFNAGLIPWYTNMLMLGLTGNFLAYILPGMVAPYNIILVKTYIESIPSSLEESAIIDGASTTRVFLRIILPLSVPILATIAIFGAVGNWNSFQDSLLLMTSAPHLYTLQHRLYIYLNQTTSINTEQISEQMAQNLLNNGVTTKYTIAMITIIPILLVYPIMQRYFVKGIMLGAVKG